LEEDKKRMEQVGGRLEKVGGWSRLQQIGAVWRKVEEYWSKVIIG
jgi:hypothetical protein